METRTFQSTSSQTATTDDVVLRDGPLVRLIFRPLLVENSQTPAACIKGVFVYQRKAKADSWADITTASLATIKAGENFKLELHSAELHTLFSELDALYALHKADGMPKGRAKYVKAHSTFAALASMSDDELKAVVEGADSLGASAVARVIRWANTAENFPLLFERLEELEPDSLKNLNAALGVALLKRARLTWLRNKENADEGFWQDLLSNQSFVLEQVFSLPVVVIQQKAYVGGKTITNSGGHIADFVIKNAVTNSIGLIEIKTPKTKLLGSEYRAGIYNVSSDLTGAVQQVLAYRKSLIDERSQLLEGDKELESFSPRCVVLIGNAKNELIDSHKRQAFELYRAQLSDVEVITYDEMYERTRRLVELLEGSE